MQTSGADSEPRMTDSPFDVLADELGAITGRIERELRQTVALEVERLGRAYAEATLRVRDLEIALGQKIAQVKDGKDGAPGADGKDGRDGKDGADGAPGERGQDGVGEPGPPGSDGRSFTLCGLYNEQAAYSALDVVSKDGGAFAAVRDEPGPCPGEGWQLIARQGKPGSRGPKEQA